VWDGWALGVGSSPDSLPFRQAILARLRDADDARREGEARAAAERESTLRRAELQAVRDNEAVRAADVALAQRQRQLEVADVMSLFSLFLFFLEHDRPLRIFGSDGAMHFALEGICVVEIYK
jgi:hypothetical protein